HLLSDSMDLLTFLLAVLLLELTPGPNMAYLATLALSRGRAAGLIATAGVAFGLAVHAVVAGLGAGVLIQQYPLLYDTLRWIGVGYLLYLAWEGWQPKRRFPPSASTSPPWLVRCSCAEFSRTSSIPNPSCSSFRCFPA